jgi:hypothetical protein
MDQEQEQQLWAVVDDFGRRSSRPTMPNPLSNFDDAGRFTAHDGRTRPHWDRPDTLRADLIQGGKSAAAGAVGSVPFLPESVQRMLGEEQAKAPAMGVIGSIAAVPPIAKGIGAAGKALASLPVAGQAAAAGGVGLLAAPSEAANEQKRTGATEAVRTHPEVTAARKKIEELAAERIRVVKTPIANMKAGDANAARDKAAAAIDQQMAAAREAEAALSKRVEAEYMKDAPFRERYPGVAENIATGTYLLGGGLSFVNQLKSRLANASVFAPGLDRAANTAERLAEGVPKQAATPGGMFGVGAKPATPAIKPNQDKFATEQTRLKDRLSDYERRVKDTDVFGDSVKAPLTASTTKDGLANSLLNFEASSLPEQFDALAGDPGTKRREDAAQALVDPMYWAERAPAAVTGGFAAATVGKKIGSSITPDARADVYKARELANRKLPPSPSGGTSVRPDGPVPPSGPQQLGGARLEATGTTSSNPPVTPDIPPRSLPGKKASAPAYSEAHGDASRRVLEDELRDGATSIDPKKIRPMLEQSFAKDGLAPVKSGELSKRVNRSSDDLTRTIDFMKDRGLDTTPSDVPAILKMISGGKGQLAVPLTVGAGASALDSLTQEQAAAILQALGGEQR